MRSIPFDYGYLLVSDDGGLLGFILPDLPAAGSLEEPWREATPLSCARALRDTLADGSEQ